MNWPAYAEYKDSEADWIDQIPISWRSTSLRWVSRRFAGGTPDRSNLSFWTDGTIPWLNSGSVNQPRITAPSALITAEAFAQSSARWVPSGSLLIALAGQGKTKGMVARLEIDSTCNQSMAAIVPERSIVKSSYLYWWLASQYQNIRNLAGGDLRDGLNLEHIGSIPVPLPELAEQSAISNFLDRETAKIDALIAKQEQLIATLREDRAATITQAVTKGLDPNVEVTDSGVERLGVVPSHWVVPQVGWHTTVGNGATPARDNQRYWADGTIPWLNSGHVNRDRITDADQFVTDIAMLECHLPMVPAGSVLVGLTGQGKTRGMASLLTVPSTINQHLAYLTPASNQIDALYLLYAIRSAYDHLRELSEENGSTKGGLTCTALRKLRVPLPPLAEQRAIAEFLVARCARIDALIVKSAEMIETLREYRSALITDAVTGTIDVRGVA